MSTTPPSPLQLYLQSGLTASSGVDAALLNAPNIAPTNAITEQLTNLQLPATQSLFAPADYWDYTTPQMLSQDPMQSGITATGDATGAASTLSGAFSLFGLDSTTSWLIVGGALLLLFAGGKRHA
jgi:hypothetical protein